MLAVAKETGRILVSHDRKTMPSHFSRFLTANSSRGLIIVSQDTDIGAAIDDLLLVWASTGQEEWINQVGYIPL